MSHKNYSPNLAQKAWLFIKGLIVNLSILFLKLFRFMEGHKRLFCGNLPAMFIKYVVKSV